MSFIFSFFVTVVSTRTIYVEKFKKLDEVTFDFISIEIGIS